MQDNTGYIMNDKNGYQKRSNTFSPHITKTIKTLIISATISCSTALAGGFDEGNTSGSLAIGNGQLFQENYLIIGIGIGHYVIDGLEIGLEIDAWTGGDPSIYEVTPRITYVIDNPTDVKPYLGAFYNRSFVEDLEDRDSYGYRAGFYAPAGNHTFIGIGLVHTQLQDCTETAFVSCSDTYSEVSYSFIFKL